MNKVDKIKKVLQGEDIGEVPFSFWTHFPEVDLDAEKIASLTFDFYKKYNLDFIKTMNNGMYTTEDYGCIADYSEIAIGGVAKIVETPIQTYEDWKDFPYKSLEESPALQRELDYLKKLLALVDGEAPVVMTVFSPLTTADKIVQGKIKDYLQQDSKGYVKEALYKIAQLTASLSAAAIQLGADGVYFASQLSTFERLTSSEYIEFGRTYDLIALEGAQAGWFNSLHLHGRDTMFDIVKDYPVQVINWHVGESFPSPREGQIYSKKTVLGGLNRKDISHSNYNHLHNQIYKTLFGTGGKGIILTPGCVVPQPFSDDIIDYVKKVKKETEQFIFENSLGSSLL